MFCVQLIECNCSLNISIRSSNELSITRYHHINGIDCCSYKAAIDCCSPFLWIPTCRVRNFRPCMGHVELETAPPSLGLYICSLNLSLSLKSGTNLFFVHTFRSSVSPSYSPTSSALCLLRKAASGVWVFSYFYLFSLLCIREFEYHVLIFLFLWKLPPTQTPSCTYSLSSPW